MIVVDKSGTLFFKNIKYKCALGKNGLTNNKKEGDGCTPIGVFSLGNLYYRSDRIKNIKGSLKKIPITEKMYWCDDPISPNYNKLIKNSLNKSEKLMRKDSIYDLVIDIKYNHNPTIPHKGSAIFIHITRGDYIPTKGCIALKKHDLLALIKEIDQKDMIKIK